MKASVILCTHNRGNLVSDTVEHLMAQDFPPQDFEVLVVDNASSDATPQVVSRLVDEFPGRVRAIKEDKLGLSTARNAGVRSTRGEVIAFTDDDGLPSSGWLSGLVAACGRDGVWCAGGPVIPLYQGELPEWVSPELLPYLSVFDKGDTGAELFYNEYPRGVNMAFRREAFERVGLFSRQLGRRGGSLLSYEEIELCYRIERAGGKILYVPEAAVRHLVVTERLTTGWFLERFYWQGKSEAYFDLMHRGPRTVVEQVRAHVRAGSGGGGSPLYRRCRRATLRGYLMGLAVGLLTGVRLKAPGRLRSSPALALSTTRREG